MSCSWQLIKKMNSQSTLPCSESTEIVESARYIDHYSYVLLKMWLNFLEMTEVQHDFDSHPADLQASDW
jgi:hypothetical protein